MFIEAFQFYVLSVNFEEDRFFLDLIDILFFKLKFCSYLLSLWVKKVDLYSLSFSILSISS